MNIDNFISFVIGTNGNPSFFDEIDFDFKTFCDSNHYAWDFPCPTDVKQTFKIKINVSDVDNNLIEFIHNLKTNSNLDDAQKIIALRLGLAYSDKFKDKIPPHHSAYFMLGPWGNVDARQKKWNQLTDQEKSDRREKIELFGQLIQKQNIPGAIKQLIIQNKNFGGISSWSKVLSVANPADFFVYDSRISVVLRLLWSAYINTMQQPLNGTPCPFYLLKVGQNSILKDCILNTKINTWLDQNNHVDIFNSYEIYCAFIKKIADCYLTQEKISSSDRYITDILSAAHVSTTRITNPIKIIARQMVEASLFALIGRSKSKRGHSCYFFERTKEYSESETPGFNTDRMPQLQALMRAAKKDSTKPIVLN